jgi:hypothetical protein
VSPASSEYRLSRAIAARLLGALLLASGVLLVLVVVLVAALGLPGEVVSVGVCLVAAIVVLGGLAVTRRVTVVRLDAEGYRVSFVRGAGATRARWTDVEDVVATTLAGERCIVIRLRDGRSTTVPVRILAGAPDAFVHDLQERLNTGHGYRRIN